MPPERFLLVSYLLLRLLQQVVEHLLARTNRRYTQDPVRRAEAARRLGVSEPELESAASYAADRYRLGRISGWTEVLVLLGFTGAGGLGLVDEVARRLSPPLGAVGEGLTFFLLLGLGRYLLELPFAWYSVFVVEERHGFNRQTPGGFAGDQLKSLAVGALLGGSLLGALLAIAVPAPRGWWLAAWLVVAAFNLLVVWLYPTLVAPLFNRFTPLPEGELRERILELARHVGFRAGGVFVMDASRRSSHGNAYFTGLFGEKRIVLFDTLLEALGEAEVVAVLAHELGHFKLKHVRSFLLRTLASSFGMFALLGACRTWAPLQAAFGIDVVSAHGALVCFALFWEIAGFALQPLHNHISRRQEYAADAFALQSGATREELAGAFLKLRERSRGMPISHPLFSRVYHTHPPLLERLSAIGAI